MGGKGGSSSPTPDPMIGEAAMKQAEIGQGYLDFAKDQFAIGNDRQEQMDELSKKLTDQQYGISDRQDKWAQEDRQRYKDMYQPVEDEFVKEATNYDTPEKQAEAAAAAKSDIMTNAAGAEQQSQRQMASMGVNPNSGRFAGVDRAGDLTVGLAAGGAQNTARQIVRDKGLALKADVTNLGRGLPAQSAQATTVGLGAGQAAMGTMGAANANFYQNNQTMMQGAQVGMQGYAGQASALNNQYGTQVNAAGQANQAAATSAAGTGQMVGAGLGMAAMMF